MMNPPPQCLDNVHFNNLFRSSMSDTSSITMPHFIKNDPKLFRDDVDIRFSRTLNSCKVWRSTSVNKILNVLIRGPHVLLKAQRC